MRPLLRLENKRRQEQALLPYVNSVECWKTENIKEQPLLAKPHTNIECISKMLPVFKEHLFTGKAFDEKENKRNFAVKKSEMHKINWKGGRTPSLASAVAIRGCDARALAKCGILIFAYHLDNDKRSSR